MFLSLHVFVVRLELDGAVHCERQAPATAKNAEIFLSLSCHISSIVKSGQEHVQLLNFYTFTHVFWSCTQRCIYVHTHELCRKRDELNIKLIQQHVPQEKPSIHLSHNVGYVPQCKYSIILLESKSRSIFIVVSLSWLILGERGQASLKNSSQHFMLPIKSSVSSLRWKF